MSVGMAIAIIGLCVVLQGFFSGSEIALVSADRLELRAQAKEGSRGAAMALAMLENPARTLGTCLVGTNLSLITATTVASALVADGFGLPAAATAAFVVPITLTFGEMVPKAIYQHHATRLAPVVVFPLRVVSWLVAPLLVFLEVVNRFIGDAEHGQGVTREELRLLLDNDQVRSPDLSATDRELLQRVLAFTEAVVEDAMVPLIQVKAIDDEATIADAARAMARSGHSRLPIYSGRIDRIVGIVLHPDLLASDDWTRPVTEVARPPFFVPESKPVDELLVEMRRQRQRMAVAVDEYGGAAGIITIEDLLEEIVGEIEDESDRTRPRVRRVGDREWLALGRAEREHLSTACGIELPDGDFETIAGFVLSELGRVPAAGDGVTAGRYTLTVSKASDRAVLEVRIRRDR
jgi:CBS domain containing-hemolysin-like protein